MTIAILDARDKEYVVVAAGADLIATYVQQAILAGQTAQEVLDAILAAGLAEGVFPSLAAGEAGTTDGQYFWVGDAGQVTLYLNDTGTGDEIAELATMAAVTFQQTGTGSVPETLQTEMLRGPAAPESFGGSLLAVATAHTEIRLARGATYTLAAMVDLSALNGRRIHMNGATIEAAGGFTDTHLLSMSGDSHLIGPGTFDGSNVPAPTVPYASDDYPGVAVFITGTGDDGSIEGVEFNNFQSGPILHDSTTTRSGFAVRRCVFTNNQLYTTDGTNSIVAMHGVDNGVMEDCRAVGYNWKAFYFTNGSFNKIVRCHADGGVIGHASHFLGGGSDNSIIDCSHEGVGFGVKIDDELRPSVINFKLHSGRSAIYVQSCTDFEIIGGQAFDPTAHAILIDGANGNCSGSVIGFRAERATPGTTNAHVGVFLQSFAAGVVSGVTIANCYFRNFLWGVSAPNVGFALTDIRVLHNEFRNTGQYGVIGWIGSAIVAHNLFEMDGVAVEAAVHIERDGVTTTGTVTIESNRIRGCTADNIEQLGRQHYKAVRILNNTFEGGTVFLNFSCNGNTADTVSVLEVRGNEGSGVTTGCSLTFNTTTSTRLRAEGNTLLNGSFVPVADSLTNLTNVTSLAAVRRGTATLAAGTAAVTLSPAYPSTSYRISLSGNAAETFSWASKAAGGFTINSSNGSSTASVDWVATANWSESV